MKSTFLALILLSIIVCNAGAQNRRLKSGVWLKAGYAATSSNFLTDGTETGDVKTSNFGLNAQFGTTFYIGPRIADKLRFGIDVSWLDFSYFPLTKDFASSGEDYFLNFLAPGPIVTFAPNQLIAFDLYGHIVPSLTFLYYNTDNYGSYNEYYYWGYNTNGLIGMNFRIKVFSVGLEYYIGKMRYISTESDKYPDATGINVSHLRILLGFKF